MVSGGTVGRRYARAILDVASETGDYDRWLRDLMALEEALGDPAVEAFLNNPNLALAAKYRVVEQLLPTMTRLEGNLVKLLIHRRRLEVLSAIRAELQRLVDERRGLLRASVTTALPLDSSRASQVTRRLEEVTGKQVLLQQSVDPSILGGIVIRIGDRVIDGSLASRLQALRQRLS